MAVRTEAVASFHLTAFRARGWAPYAGGGVAVTFTRDAVWEALTMLVGIETNPGGRSGWFFEGGVGGGLRVSAGFRGRIL